MIDILLLGASGSIGSQVLDVIKNNPSNFRLVGFSCFNDASKINKILKDFPSVECIGVINKEDNINLDNIYFGKDANIKLLDYFNDVLVVNAISGCDGLEPTIHCIRNNLDLALANKESVVCGGNLIKKELEEHSNVSIFPIDSEHSAIFQCLAGEKYDDIDELIITCSGGPFRNYNKEGFYNIKVKDALNHPTWSMGKKITIDSSTLFNKGLEIIEAYYLFGIDPSKIKAIIQPTSQVHSLVSFKDGTVKALLSNNDMRLPILYALNKTNRISTLNRFNIENLTNIEFKKINTDLFPSIPLAYKVLELGGNSPTIYCVSNEVAVESFLNEEISFLDIFKVVDHMVNTYEKKDNYNYEQLIDMIDDIKKQTRLYIDKLKGE